MKTRQRQRIVARHKSSLYQHGMSPRALFWQDEQVQRLRFDILLECGISRGDSVLDVGCGFADLYRYMEAKGLDVTYTGLDLSPDLLAAARRRDPSLAMATGDIFDFNPDAQSYDWVLMSGALNEPLQDNGDYLRRCLPRFYDSARKGVAFNLLNADYPWSDRELFHLQPYHPADILRQLQALSDCYAVRDDYLETDASYFIWRDKSLVPLKD